MLKLLASAPGDGWAFVEKDQKTLLVRPPYRQWALTSAPEGAVEKAVQHHGFVVQDETFQDWDSLVTHLRDEYLARRREQDAATPDLAEVRSLLHVAPPYILADYLDRVESELLPQKEWSSALDLLTYLLGVEAVKADPDLYDRTVRLLLQSQEAMRAEEARRMAMAVPDLDFVHMFPQAAQAYGAAAVRGLAERVVRQGQIFAMG